jgi:hypothetical protein
VACISCIERGELLMKARDAYRRGDKAESKRLFNEAWRTVGRDIGNLTAMVFKRSDGTEERFDFTEPSS